MKRIGEIGLIPVIAKQQERKTRHASKNTLAELKRRAAADAIKADPAGAETVYTARQLVQCTLPYKDPGDVPVWTRKSGNVSLGVQPGVDLDTGTSLGYPYGVIPRLVLFWLITQLVHRKDRADLTNEQKRRVELGALPDFMRQLGLDPRRGGKRSDRQRLEDQMHRLFRSRISFQESRKNADGSRAGMAWLNMEVAPKGELWWDTERRGQPSLFPSWVQIGEDFQAAATAVPVPVDMRALKALKRSPLALDLYALLSFVAYIANSRDAAQLVKWRGLSDQLGGSYADVKNLKKAVQGELTKVGQFLDISLLPVPGGFKVLPGGKPAILPKGKGRAAKAG